MIKTFREQLNDGINEEDLKYNAGYVRKHNDDFVVSTYQIGAGETFSIGQPLYNENGDILGYLGIGCFDELSEHVPIDIYVPAYYWKICKPSNYCADGVRVFTYWQKERGDEK